MRRISTIITEMERLVETDSDDCWSDADGRLESLSYLVDEMREVITAFKPGEGWAPFGTHLDCPVKLEFRESDDAGMPMWERVVSGILPTAHYVNYGDGLDEYDLDEYDPPPTAAASQPIDYTEVDND